MQPVSIIGEFKNAGMTHQQRLFDSDSCTQTHAGLPPHAAWTYRLRIKQRGEPLRVKCFQTDGFGFSAADVYFLRGPSAGHAGAAKCLGMRS